MAEIESGTFYLTTWSASSVTNGNYIKYNSFNIKECLGDMYDKYDKFKLVLNGVSNFNGMAVTNRLVSIKMTGLDWIGCYDYGTNITTEATLGIINVASTGGINLQTPSNWGCCFSKPSSHSVNLTIIYHDIKINAVDPSTNYNLSTFIFSVYGVN